MKKYLLILSAVSLSCCIQHSVRAGDSSLIIVGMTNSEDHSTIAGWKLFRDIVERDSGGKLAVEIYPNNQLANGDREHIEAVQLNNIQISQSGPQAIAPFAQEFYIWDPPFAFDTREEIYAKLDGDPGKSLLSYFEPIHIKGLGFMETGFRHLTANKMILTPDDLKGLKIRVVENRIHILIWSLLGANPTPISYGELFTALQQGTVDAQENPFENIYTSKVYEVQKYVMTTSHMFTPMVIFMNLEFFNALSPEHQDLVLRAANEAVIYQRKASLEATDNAIKEVGKVCEILDLTPDQREAFRTKMSAVHSEIRKLVDNDELFDAFIK